MELSRQNPVSSAETMVLETQEMTVNLIPMDELRIAWEILREEILTNAKISSIEFESSDGKIARPKIPFAT